MAYLIVAMMSLYLAMTRFGAAMTSLYVTMAYLSAAMTFLDDAETC
jgi:hypothetical protein